VGLAAAHTTALPAIFGADEAVFISAAGAVATPAAATAAVAAAELLHLSHANGIPRELATERVVGAHAGLDGGVVAAGSVLHFAAVTLARAGAAVLGARFAAFAGLALAVAA